MSKSTESKSYPHILWVGDAVVSTGFSRCTHNVCDYLHNQGWRVSVLGLNYFGDPHPYPYDIYPCRQPWDGGHDGFGATRLPILDKRLNPDIIVLLNDPWNIPAYLNHLPVEDRPKVIGWLAVDGKNQKGHELNDLDLVVVWTEFAKEELTNTGCTVPIHVVPLGVDLSIFHPVDKYQARTSNMYPQNKQLPTDAYVVGVVGRNQPRKRLDLTLKYFKKWITDYRIPDAYLYLYVAPTGETGCDLHQLVKYYELQDRVIENTPHKGLGNKDSTLTYLYSGFDCLLTTTQGEGWGLPMLEAMACGVPVIAPNWSGLGSWAHNAAYLVDCDSTALTAPLNGNPYTIGGVASERDTVSALDDVYRFSSLRQDLINRGLSLSKELTWDNTAFNMYKLLRRSLPFS